VEKISELDRNGIPVRFYSGIDFNLISNHPSDGSDGMLVFFVDDFNKEVYSFERDNKIRGILNEEISKIDPEFNGNSCISIYQTYGKTEDYYKIIRRKFEEEDVNIWRPIGIKPNTFI
jgi:hypothetical protein